MWREYFSKITGISIYLTLASVIIMPEAGNRTVADYNFPQKIELDSGTTITSTHPTEAMPMPNGSLATASFAIAEEPDSTETIKASRRYKLKEDRKINLEISYLVNTRGNVEAYLQQYTSIGSRAIATQQRRLETVGHHLLFATEKHAYLSSCISPRSLSNVTQKQFSQQRYQNDLRWDVGWKWLTGKASIRDRRCLWVNLSTPIVGDTQAAYQSLETVWTEIYHWWLPNFPPLS